MSGDAKDKPFEPTPHKLEEARKRGEVPAVREFPQMVALAALGLVVVLASGGMAAVVLALFDGALAAVAETPLHAAHGWPSWGAAVGLVLVLVVPLLVAGLAGTVLKRLMIGPVFSAKPLAPDFKRINPAQGFTRLFSAETWATALRALVSMGAVGLLLGAWLWHQAPVLLAIHDAESALKVGWALLQTQAALAIGVLAVIGLVDAFHQVRMHRRKLRMDMKDLRDEHKLMEGHPEQKAERKAEHRRLIR